MHRIFWHCRHSFCHLKKFSWGGGGGALCFPQYLGNSNTLGKRISCFRKRCQKSLSCILPSPPFFFFLNLLFLSRSHVTFRKDCGVPVLPWNHPYRCWGNLKGGPPNLAGHSKQTHGQTASRTPDKINRFTRRSITDR